MAEPEQPNEPPPDATSARIESVLGKLRPAGGPSNSASRPEDLTNGDASLSTYAFPSSLSRLLSTFSTRTWFAKPLGLLDALTCAARGWKNAGEDVLQCDGCGRELLVRVSVSDKGTDVGKDRTSEEAVEKEIKWGMARRFHGLLSTEHEPSCLFRDGNGGGWDDTDTRFPTVSAVEATSRYNERVKALSLIPSDFIPSTLTVSGRPVLDVTPTTALSPSPQSHLALFNWTPHPSSTPTKPSLACTTCLRQPALWLFSCSATSTSDIARSISLDAFDLEREHEEWCPWIDPARGKGWEATLKLLQKDLEPKEVPRKRYRISEGGEGVEGEEVLSLEEATRRIRGFLYV